MFSVAFSLLDKQNIKELPDPFGTVLEREKKPRPKPALIRKSFRSLLPDIISTLMTEPSLGYDRLYQRFMDRLSDCPDPRKFKALCSKYKVKESVKQGLSPQAQTMTVIKTLEQVRKDKAEEHERRNMKYLDKAHDVLETIEPTKASLSDYLTDVAALNKLARTSYGIDLEEKKNDPRQVGLYALISMNLTQDSSDPKSPPESIEVER